MAYSMSNLNIEACRHHWESDERWALKKEFLKTFQHRFDEDRLLCLAEIYVNVQRLHCSYPAPLMTQIKELAKELNHRTALQQTRKAQQNILFVKEGGGGNPVKRDISQGSTVHPHVKRVKLQNANTSSKNFDINSNQRALSNINKQLHVSEDDLSVCTNQTPIRIMETMKLGTTNNSYHLDKSFSIDIIAEKLKNIKIIASHIRPYLQKQKGTHWDILHRVCMKSGFSLSCNIVKDSNIEFTITIQVFDVILAKATAYTKKVLRNKVAKKALEILLSAFKIVSDGENLILKKDEDLTATSNTDRQPCVSKNSNDLDMHTNCSTIPISETTKLETANRCFRLNQPFSPDTYVEKLEKIRKIASQIHPPTQNKKWRCWQLLHDVCMKSNCSLSCNITSSQNSEFVVTLKVLDVILSKVTHSDKKLLKYKAAKKAVEILRHSAFKIVSDEQNLILKEDEEKTETSDTNEQPVVSESNNDSGIHINETPTPRIEAEKPKTADSSSLLNEPFSTDIYVEKLEEIKKIASQLYPFKPKINKKWAYWHLLHDACMKSGYSLSYNITTVEKPTFTITLKIFDVILSKVTHSKKKLLKAKAANMAVQILHSAFKIVSDGENLILEKGDEQTVVTNPNEELCMLKGDSDPYVSTNQSPKPRIKSTEVKTNGMSFEVDESSSTNNIIADKVNKLKMIVPKIRPEILCSKNCELKCFSALQSVCQKLHYPFSCVVIQNPNSQFTGMFKVLDVIVSQVTDSTKNALKSKAAKKALENLLYFTFKIVYNGENLILKVDEEHAATSNAHTEPSVLKDDNNPGINTNQSSTSIITTAKAETNDRLSSQLDKSSSMSDVFADKLNKIKMIAPQIHPHMLHEGEWKHWAALHLACAKLNYLVSWDIMREQNSQLTITVKVLGVILSKVTDSTRKLLKAKAGKKALELLLHSSVKIVSDGENLMLKVDEEQAAKLSDSQIEQPNLKPLFPLTPTCASWLLIEQNGQTKNFPLDPSLQHYFCILDSGVSFSSSPVCVLVSSAEFCKVPLRFDLQVDCGPPVSYIYDLFLKDHKICSASSPKKTDAKDLVCRAALDSLSKVVYTIKINNTNLDASIVLRHQVFDCPDSPPGLAETNIGCKLLKKMGWSGGGIGKEGNTGIVEPIKVWIGQSRGQGLGYSDKRKNPKANKTHIEFLHAKISSFLLNYTDSNTLNDLVFADDFSSEEKKYIHMLASKYNLKSGSRGRGEAKRVSIERRLSLQELLDHLKKAGGPIGKYTLITPQQYVEGYSEDTST